MKNISLGLLVAAVLMGRLSFAKENPTQPGGAATAEPATTLGQMVDPSTIPGVMQQQKLVLPPAPKPPARGDFVGLSTTNGRLAWEFFDLWFNQKKGEEAFDRYVSKTEFFNHNSKQAEQTFESQRRIESQDVPPAARFTFKQVIAQGELVMLHIQAVASPTLPEDELVAIVRIRGGKVIDHWDLHVPLSSGSNTFARMDR